LSLYLVDADDNDIASEVELRQLLEAMEVALEATRPL
jgi:hypothetical protein